jgi:hypothetical protein
MSPSRVMSSHPNTASLLGIHMYIKLPCASLLVVLDELVCLLDATNVCRSMQIHICPHTHFSHVRLFSREDSKLKIAQP